MNSEYVTYIAIALVAVTAFWVVKTAIDTIFKIVVLIALVCLCWYFIGNPEYNLAVEAWEYISPITQMVIDFVEENIGGIK